MRRRAALAAGRIQDSSWVEPLRPLLADPDREVRREAIFALGQIGHASARAGLEPKLADPDLETVTLAAEALGKLGDRAATARVAPLLTHATPGVRGAAAVALWRLADSTALGALLDRASDPDPGARWRVLWALEKIVAPARVVPAVAPRLADGEWLTRAYAARTLGRQKSPLATQALLGVLADPEHAVVINAIRALQSIADSSCASCGDRLAAALRHRHAYVRQTAATALHERFAFAGASETSRALMLDALEKGLADSDAATRGACARALIAQLGQEAFARGVDRVLNDPSPYARVAALDALKELHGGPARGDMLRERAGRTRPMIERMTALDVLGARRERGAAEFLRASLADTSVLIVAAAASALAEMRDSASVTNLARTYGERARDADADARISIRDALRDLAGRAYADSVERAWPPPAAPASAAYTADFAELPAARSALIRTTSGDIEITFYREEAPQTVRNFARLAARHYFDGAFVHRVVPNFVIQDGDPTGTGSGGPGYSIRCEYNRLHYEPGMVGMALSGKDTGGSQWFITHSPQLHLDGRYTIFARVTHGMDAVHRITQGDRVLSVRVRK